ncbi:MAG: TIGR01244 family sulfur transferase [Pseudomonadota bacterium]
MKLRQLTADSFVANQLEASDFAMLKQLGFRSVLNNRPNSESVDQPEEARLREAARRTGLRYAAAPIGNQDLTAAEVSATRAALASLPTPVCAFCRSGTRAMLAWAIIHSQDGDEGIDVLKAVSAAGFQGNDVAQRLRNYYERTNQEPLPVEEPLHD